MDRKDGLNEGPADTRGFIPLFAAAQVCALVSVILILVWSDQYMGGFAWSNAGTRFNWHPVLMIVAFVFLYGNGALVYRLLRNEPKYQLKLIHGFINGAAFLLSAIGLWAVFSFHNEANIPNMYSMHSWLGLGTVILFGLNLTGGAIFFLLPIAPVNLRALVLPIHVFSGQVLLGLILTCIISGINEKAFFRLTGDRAYGKMPSEAYVANFLGVAVTLFFLIVTYAVSKPEYKRRPLASDNQTPVRLPMSESVH